MKKHLLLYIKLLSVLISMAQGGVVENGAILSRAQKALTDVIVHDIFSPPVASRIYAYCNISAYEILIKEHREYRSLHGQIRTFPSIPSPASKIDYSISAITAFMETGKRLVFSEKVLNDSASAILGSYKIKKTNNKLWVASVAYGKIIADSIWQWIGQDHYKETRKMSRYRLVKKEGKWIPTPPGYMAAIEPYWNKIRTLVLDSSNQVKPDPAIIFSADTASVFYKQAYEVYKAGKQLTGEQKEIAGFWDCNPFALNTSGHLMFATKKISPGGHWMSIIGIIASKKKLSLMETSAAYTLTAITLFDAFISCWDEKYRSNVIRPETYINRYIDESWRPLLQTPPFPEYTSGHSVISVASAVVLSKLFGDSVSYDDTTENEFGLSTRHFNSFLEAANEAAISRFYGGIHYHAAIENGVAEGKKIGNWVLQHIQLNNSEIPK